ncbi:hypothetical protein IHQ68_18025 [Chelatococcus sambhunathii]|uniref:Uncharacterized protein n=1 Tax=Chelatococcus sambhunathii TaxID=363953 RepID=A0ABU1DK74_9HYPH|nr:hypothetical protein [Chelatococcus sambhunathii]MDR4308521.1 hypothetical protein [Chelatococcus sambhunathii]
MPYVVRWVPRGPDMSVTCHSMADVLELTREIKASGRGMDLHVLRDDVEIDLDTLPSISSADVQK